MINEIIFSLPSLADFSKEVDDRIAFFKLRKKTEGFFSLYNACYYFGLTKGSFISCLP